MQLTEHFTYEEAVISRTATELGIDNSPSIEIHAEILDTAYWMEGIRSLLNDCPIIVTSWFRCYELEAAITKMSVLQARQSSGHHPKGAAVDFVCPSFGTPYDVAKHLERFVDIYSIGQLIYEYGRWVHISRLPVEKPINRVLTANRTGWHPGII